MLTLLTVVAALALGQSSPSAIRFDPHPGWHVGAVAARSCPGVSLSRCRQAFSWASTAPIKDCVGCLPHRTLARLPSDGIVIQVNRVVENPLVAKQRLAWPPTVRSSQIGGLEGVPARIGVYQLVARLGRTEVMVFVFFGRARPSASQLRAANGALRSSRLA
jgi:hypothetical protein